MFSDLNNAVDVWSVKKINPQSMVHLTEKPVEPVGGALQYSSWPGRTSDLFGGSGSTLIAAEQHQRHAHLMELDPLYCERHRPALVKSLYRPKAYTLKPMPRRSGLIISLRAPTRFAMGLGHC